MDARCPQCAAMHERMKFAEDEAVRQARIANGAMKDADDAREQLRGAVEAMREALESLDPDGGNRRESDITYARETLERAIERGQ